MFLFQVNKSILVIYVARLSDPVVSRGDFI